MSAVGTILEKLRGKPINDVKATPVPEPEALERDVKAELKSKRAERNQALQRRVDRRRQKNKIGQHRSALLATRKQVESQARSGVLVKDRSVDTAQLDAELAAIDRQLVDLADDGSQLVDQLEAEVDVLQEELIRTKRLAERIDAGKVFRAVLTRHGQQPFFEWCRDVHKKADAAREAEAQLELDIAELQGDRKLRFLQRREVAKAVEAACPQSGTPAEVAGYTLWLLGEWLRLPKSPVAKAWEDVGVEMNHAGGSILYAAPLTENDLATLQSGLLPRL